MAKLGQYNVENMTAQEVYDVACEHLITQGRKCTDEFERCVYKGDNDLTCGAGIFIQGYEPEMETNAWDDLVYGFNQCPHHEELITRIQSIHDGCYPPHWRELLYDLAHSEGLKAHALTVPD